MSIWSDTMEKILDLITGNTVVFVIVILVLVGVLVGLIMSMGKGAKKKKKIHIYDDEVENDDLKKVKTKDIVEKTQKRR